MKHKSNIFAVGFLAFLIVLMPVFCCCVTENAFAQGPKGDVAAKGHACCDKQAAPKALPHNPNQCDCPQHSFSKAAGTVSSTLEASFFLGRLGVSVRDVFAEIFFNKDTFSASLFDSIHSPPSFSTPLYIQQHSLRV